jgi:hypothetical protein
MRTCPTINWPHAFYVCLFGAILSLSLYGCGGTFRSFPGEGDVSGNWDLVLANSGVTVRSPQVSIVQKERYEDFTGTTSDGATLTGSLSGNNISVTLNNADGSTTTLDGKLSDDWKSMSGTYTSTGSDGSGTWSATRPQTKPKLVVAPTSATLSCSQGQSVTFGVTGGTTANYTVVASTNGSLVTLSTTTLTTNGQFTVTANTSCAGQDVTTVNLTVSDVASSVIVPVTISNP